MYVFAYSWSPGFCNTQSNDPGCASPDAYWGNHFTIHGLWPQYTTSGYPAACTTEAFDPSAPQSIGLSTMEQYWPNVQAAEGASNYDDFWSHEWSKHGTCSGLPQTEYFNTTVNLLRSFGTPAIFTQNVGKSVSADDLRDALGGATMASLLCSNGQLTGAYTCWSQTNGLPQKQTTCPASVQSEDTCKGSSTVLVVGF
jgi:ribonuclease T2